MYRSLTRHTAAAAIALSLHAATLEAASFIWKTSVNGGSWSSPTNWSATSPGGSDNAGAPNDNSVVSITLADGINRTINYDYNGPALTVALLQVDLTGASGDATSTLNMTANALTVATCYTGYSGAGTNGTGVFNVSGGALTITPTGNGFYVGLNASDKGTFTLANATMTASNAESIGYQGTGVFSQSSGTNTINPGANVLYLGQLPGSNGTYNLSGGTLTTNCPVRIGNLGAGTFNQSGGLFNAAGNSFVLGLNAGTTGTYTLSANTTLLVNSPEIIGSSGTGTFNQSGGMHTVAGEIDLASLPGSTGVLSLSGGSLNAAGVYLGGNSTSNGGVGFLGISGGVMNIAGLQRLNSNSGLTLSGGTLITGAVLYGGNPSNFNWTNGRLVVTNLTVTVDSAGNLPSLALNNAQSASFMGTDFILGSLASLTVGDQNSGSVTQGGSSSVSVAHDLVIARGTFAIGAYTVASAAATLNVYGNVYLDPGNSTAGSSNLNISAGSVTVAGFVKTSFTGTVTLSGGMLSAGTLTALTSLGIVDAVDGFAWTGGTLNITNATFRVGKVNSDILFRTLSGSQVGNFSGTSDSFNDGLVVGGDNSQGTLTQAGTTTITVGTPVTPRNLSIAPTFAQSAYALDSASASLTVHGNLYIGGSANGPAQSPSFGLFTLAAGNAAVNGTIKPWNDGTLTLSGGTLSAVNVDLSANPAGLQFSAGTFVLTGGALFGASNFTIPAGATLTGTGSIQSPLTLNGRIIAADPYDPLSIHGTTTGPGAISVSPGATLVADPLRISSLTVSGLARLRPTASPSTGASSLSILTIAGTTNNWSGKLDLTNNALILQFATAAAKTNALPAVQNQLLSGNANNTWTGNGITSSTVALDPAHLGLALANNADLHLATFRGQALDDNALIITQATPGDANLDQKVDAFDLNLLAAHWQQAANALWSAGDFTGDGKVDAFDLNVLASHWQFSAASLQAALAQFPNPTASVPEPASMVFVVVGASALPMRRRRRRTT